MSDCAPLLDLFNQSQAGEELWLLLPGVVAQFVYAARCLESANAFFPSRGLCHTFKNMQSTFTGPIYRREKFPSPGLARAPRLFTIYEKSLGRVLKSSLLDGHRQKVSGKSKGRAWSSRSGAACCRALFAKTAAAIVRI
jgi:hypothetical protein